MHRCRQLFNIIFLLFFVATPVLADDFLAGTEDVPLMQELTLLPEETFDFDTQDGRLYFSKAVTSVDSEKVLDFYRQTLPQLGWKEDEFKNFVREDDVLRISTTDKQTEDGKIVTVVFELVTKSK
ncbi:MAG: hypothetical protein J6P93_04730 [Alphaproteobacteria bacterium]|nr:hypothetical protein [Alphaproteobacteria bacterium]